MTNPCPPWCAADHVTPQYEGDSGARAHLSERTVIQPAGKVARISVYLSASKHLPAEVNVHVTASTPYADSYLSPADPEALAVLISVLADATPEQHRQVADAIRRNAALQTEAGS